MTTFTREEFERICELVSLGILLIKFESRWNLKKGYF